MAAPRGNTAMAAHREGGPLHRKFKATTYTCRGVDLPIFRCKECEWGFYSTIAGRLVETAGGELMKSLIWEHSQSHTPAAVYAFLAREGLKERRC